MNTIVEVILPIPVKSNYHYKVHPTQRDAIEVGMRVLVNFGRNKIYTGIVRRFVHDLDSVNPIKLKFIEEILDEQPVLYELQLQMLEWVAFYYACTEGEVLKAALPIGLKPESSLRVEMTGGLDWQSLESDDKEYILLEALSIQPVLTFKEIARIWSILNPTPRLKVMASRGWIRMYQQVEDRYKPKLKTYLRLSDFYQADAALEQAFESLSRAPSQENLLLAIVGAWQQDKTLPKTETLKKLKIGSGAVKALIEKGYIEEEKVQIDRLEFYGYKQKQKHISLTPHQQEGMNQILSLLRKPPMKPVLLHGITGSGKTHIYIELIQMALKKKRQVLYLLPEITLTKQIIDRMKSEFGDKVGIYHSRFNDHERVEIWHKVLKREYELVIGVRSSIYLPFEDLGLIIVDEEHDQSFKQTEPAPRYNARDLAVYYSHLAGCPIILGSATPSFESFRNARLGKYHIVTLTERASNAKLPKVELVDMRAQLKNRQVKGVLSSVLHQALEETIMKGEQAILFQNRRGYAPYLVCQNCGHTPNCINCDISLTYHKGHRHLRCHYCGHTDFSIDKCPECEHFSMRRAGIGTEKVEEEIQKYFPKFRVERMDLDTTRTKLGFQQIITRFENKEIDVLVGTKMVSKGLDFENVTLVGVINADNLLTFPDFRSYEQAYQLLTQVSGRAGRSEKAGRVIVQSFMPDNIVLRSIQTPFEGFFGHEVGNRKQLAYPPFTRLIRMELRHKDHNTLEQESLRLGAILRPYFGSNLLGPDYALIARVRNKYRMQFLIKTSKSIPAHKLRQIIKTSVNAYYEQAPTKTVRILVDVDPM